MKKIKVVLLAVLLSSMLSVSVQAETLYFSVAASMTDAFKEIIALFSENYKSTRVLPNFGSSGSLAKQIVQGAPADLYVSANPKWMKYLVENKVVSAPTVKVFAFNELAFIGHPASGVSEMSAITSLQKIGIGTPGSVPAGEYAKQAMVSAGIYSILKNERRLVMAKDVRQALLYADRGEVDGSFVYKTDAILASTAKIIFIVPAKMYDRVTYPLALTVGGAEKAEAVSFYQFMASSQVSGILQKYGFEPAHESW